MAAYKFRISLAMNATLTDFDANFVLAAIRAVAPSGAICAGGRLDVPQIDLFSEEASFILRAAPKRRSEFCAGRFYARMALAELSLAPHPIPVGKSRAPIWPSDIVGSITHTDEICAVIVARQRDQVSLGLDIEDDKPLATELVSLICLSTELDEIETRKSHADIDLPKLFFVIKEAVYKMYYPIIGHFLDFHDLSVELDLDSSTFVAKLSSSFPAINGNRKFSGHFGHLKGTIFALSPFAR